MRRDGATFKQIAEALGYKGPSSAYRAVMSALRRTQQEPADELRRLELERLDEALRAIAGRVRQGNLAAIDRWIRISESRRRLLGLDAPTRTEVTGAGGGPVLLATPEWLLVRAAILEALEAHPEARQAVIEALAEVADGAGG